MVRKIKEQKNTFHTSEVIFLLVVTCIVSLFMGHAVSNDTTNQALLDNEVLSKLAKHYQYIKENYYQEISDDELLNGAISGMVGVLDDPYSAFIDATDSENFNISLEGNYSGIGIEVMNDDNNNILIVGVFDNSPAKKAGLQINDIIQSIDGKELLGKDKSELTSYVKENKMKQFNLVVLRGVEQITVIVERDRVEIPSVSASLFENDGKRIGYIYFSIFSNTTYQQFQKELDKLEENNIDSLIIDVRDNSGGHLSTAVNIVSLFLDKTKIIYQIEKKKEVTKYYSKGSHMKTYPVVILQNRNSASASELLGAAMKESYGATIIGEKSFGKGTVQKLITVGQDTEYKFTTEKWLTPNGNWIHEVGIVPDIAVELNEQYYSNPNEETDNQLQEAIRYLIAQ